MHTTVVKEKPAPDKSPPTSLTSISGDTWDPKPYSVRVSDVIVSGLVTS